MTLGTRSGRPEDFDAAPSPAALIASAFLAMRIRLVDDDGAVLAQTLVSFAILTTMVFGQRGLAGRPLVRASAVVILLAFYGKWLFESTRLPGSPMSAEFVDILPRDEGLALQAVNVFVLGFGAAHLWGRARRVATDTAVAPERPASPAHGIA